jgi:hypothetical protein
MDNLKSDIENDDNNSSSDDSSIDFSFVNTIRDQLTTSVRGVRSIPNTTRRVVSYEKVADSTESTSEETIDNDNSTQPNDNDNLLSENSVTVARHNISTATGPYESYQTSVSFLLNNIRDMTDDRVKCNNTASSASNSSDDDVLSNIRYSSSVYGNDYDTGIEKERIFDDDNVSTRNATVTNLALVERHRQSLLSGEKLESACKQASKTVNRNGTDSEDDEDDVAPIRRMTRISKAVRHFIVNENNNDDMEDTIVSRRMSRMSMAVRKQVVNEEDDDDVDPVVLRRMTRMSMAMLDMQSINIEDDEDNVTITKELYLLTCLAVPSISMHHT